MHFLRVWAALALAVLLLAAPLAAADQPAAHAAGHAEAGNVHGEQAGHGEDEGDAPNPMAADVDLAICTLLIFLLLLAVLKKFAWGPIAGALDLRERTIAEHIALAEQTHEEGKKLLAQYEAKLAAAQDEVRAILDQARRHAEQAQQELLAQARTEAQAEMQRAKREIETAKDQALIELAQRSADQAVGIAGKILGAKLDPNEHRSLIEQALTSFSQSAHLRN